ncbi:DNA-binding transcriptional LysR family regulator [Kitasatospora sp. GAS204A]|uniref:LysR family transcriptional regulator n=1 Tax=unclassified Kitasatospora TaxID=2633591 RepID=UPI002474E061|nr:LysR family transcriptional regulator [Kitasatospora sp. GAS204B]MDH6121778.1 DNA-binding transcriptional LysR family regulator [Kitasatospora sp. GAS204B]
MDLVGACRVFVQVGERGSFTLGAAAAGVPQPVASRRIAALEKHLGGLLFDRSGRRAVLTAFGRQLLPSAKRLAELADALECDAEQARLEPLEFAVPDICPVRQLAALDAAARELGMVLRFRTAGPAGRVDLLNTREVGLVLVAVPTPEATWAVPLGVADTVGADARPLHLETLRPGRVERTFRRIWIQPEDDLPHIRDQLQQLGHRAALLPAQIAVAASLTAAVAHALRNGDLLLCAPSQADELGLSWRALAGTSVARGYQLRARSGVDARRVSDGLREPIARCLGVPTDVRERA